MVKSHTVPHWKALRYGKDESKRLSYDSTPSICPDVLKSDNLLHKQGFVDSLVHIIEDDNALDVVHEISTKGKLLL